MLPPDEKPDDDARQRIFEDFSSLEDFKSSSSSNSSMNDDFSKRLESAIERGKQAADQKADEARRQEQTEERLRELHSEHRLVLCEYIEKTVNQLADHFPGFRSESVYDEDGWGSACYRENLHIENGRRTTQFSRFEIIVRPCSDLLVLDIKGKARVNSREVFNRSHFAKLAELKLQDFKTCIEAWSLQFAESYAAKS